MPPVFRAVVITVLCLILFAPVGAAPDGKTLHLRVGQFDPLQEALELPDHLRLGADLARGAAIRVVQFKGKIGPQQRETLAAAGIQVLGYLPEDTFVVRAEGATRATLQSLPGLRWEGAVEPGWKLSPELAQRPFRDPNRRVDGWLRVTVDLWPESDAAAVAQELSRAGAEIRALWTNHGLRRILMRAKPELLESAARLDAVAWIEEAPEATLRNDGASWVIQSNVENFRPIWDHGLHGEGQIVGNIDGRVDMNSCYFEDGGKSPGPSHRKVIAYRSSSGQGAESHGTHTNGTMAGDKGTWGSWDSGDGHAFAAKISFTNLDDINGSGSSPSNLLDNLVAAHQDGARTHGNSWGDDGTTSYTSWSRDIDDFSWQYEDSLVLFAVTNGSNLKTPENAKNVLAVGASEREQNADFHCSGGRGPTSDGRRKPEIYAPGCSTVSAASSQSCGTSSKTGTSMACPAVTGAAALVRQYFREGWYPSGTPTSGDTLTPTGALLKAVLISGAQDMTGVTGYPSDQEGWGRVNLEDSLFFDGDGRGLIVLDDIRRAGGLSTGGSATYQLTVDEGGQPLRITLVFTEPPADLLASEATVNNLNLRATAPDGAVYWGNQNDGSGQSIPGGSPDSKNNLEQVLFDTPQAGAWTIEVLADSVPVGPQGFALVATGGVSPVRGPRLAHESHRVLDEAPLGGGDNILDPGETALLPMTLANHGNEPATSIDGTLCVDRPDWARITQRQGMWTDLAASQSAEMNTPFYEVTLSPDAPCGQALQFIQTSRSAEAGEQTSRFSIAVGNVDRDYPDGPPIDLPASFLGAMESPQEVLEDALVGSVNVTIDLSHGDVSELMVGLISPSGTQVTLHNRSHPGEVDLKLRYDRDRAPDGPGTMADFVGESATGTWTLLVNDNRATAIAPGRLNSWTLHLRADRALDCSPLECADAIPGAGSGLNVMQSGGDLLFTWSATAGASGYHLLASSSPGMDAAVLKGRTTGETEYTDVGGAGTTPSLLFYQLRATNSCHWEGP